MFLKHSPTEFFKKGDAVNEKDKSKVVQLILDGEVEKALKIVCDSYGRKTPKLKVGKVKRHSKALAVYVPRKATIFLSKGSLARNPFIILHELYHHLRFSNGKHKGTEKYANEFALSFIKSYVLNFLKKKGATGKKVTSFCKS